VTDTKEPMNDNGENGEKPSAPKKNENEIPPNERTLYWPACSHTRFTKIDRVKFKDRVEVLKECRRCGLQRVFVTKREFGSSNVYVNTYKYDVPRHRYAPPED
jgi:hypothetical protein